MEKIKTPCLQETGGLCYALGGNRTPILRTGILRAIRCTTSANINDLHIICQIRELCKCIIGLKMNGLVILIEGKLSNILKTNCLTFIDHQCMITIHIIITFSIQRRKKNEFDSYSY